MHPPKNRVESILTLFFYAWLTLMVVMYVRHNLSFAIDDSYITYRYAYHFAEGWGLVFNVGEHHYGSTAMGFAVALGAMAWLCVHAAASVEVPITIHDTIPALATVSSALSLGVVGILFHSTARCLQSPWRRCFVSIIICLYVFWGHFPIRASGHETYPFIALMLLGSHLMLTQVRSPIAAAVTLAGATMVRPDAALFVVLLGLVLTARFVISQSSSSGQRRRNSLSLVLLSGVSIGGMSLWCGFLYVYFGSALPETMLAKQAQLTLGYFKTFTVLLALEKLWAHVPGIILVVLIAGIVCGFVERGCRCYQKGRIATPESSPPLGAVSLLWAIFPMVLLVAYEAFGVSFWGWYIVPVYYALLFLMIPSLKAVFAVVDLLPLPQTGRALLLIGLIGSFAYHQSGWITHWVKRSAYTHHTNSHIGSYEPVVTYLKEHEPNGTSLALSEPGNIGYELGPQYMVVDLLGLASPGVAQSILDGDHHEFVFRSWYPHYYVVSWMGRYDPVDQGWFTGCYERLGEFHHEYWARHRKRGIFLYRRIDSCRETL